MDQINRICNSVLQALKSPISVMEVAFWALCFVWLW